MNAGFLLSESAYFKHSVWVFTGGQRGRKAEEGRDGYMCLICIWMNSPVMCLFVATFQDHKHFKASLNLENIIQVIIWSFYNSMSI